ncbi:hypothetical protein [Allohahella marinimesophila]|uniref:Uncharacterized protein n=1 Tax=Allohahella marinimesophila TaxID=1054972 RepID=A0ABP7NUW0_9GAMM
MYARLNSKATSFNIYQSRSEFDGLVEHKGRPRKIYRTDNNKLAEIDLSADIDAQLDTVVLSCGGQISKSKVKTFSSWARSQVELIEKAYLHNAKLGLFGGVPVIRTGKRDDDKYSSESCYVASSKIGEFSGVIKDAKRIELPDSTESAPSNLDSEIDAMIAAGRLDELCDPIIQGLLRRMNSSHGKVHEIFSDEQTHKLYVAERQLYYFVTRGLSRKNSDLQVSTKHAAEEKFKNLKQTRAGYCLCKVKAILTLKLEAEYKILKR